MIQNGNATWRETDAGKQLEAQFADEATLMGLSRLLNRVNELEDTVARMSVTLQQGPGMMAMVTDSVDEGFRQARDRGVDVPARLEAALALADRLTAPDTIEKLNKVFDQMERLPDMTSMAIDSIDGIVRDARDRGVDVPARLESALQLADRLTAPDTIDKLNQAFDLVERLPGMTSMAIDSVDGIVSDARARGVDIPERLGTALQLAEKLTAPDMVHKLDGLLDTASRSEGLVAMVVDMLDEAYRDAARHGYDPESVIRKANGLLKKMSNVLNDGQIDAVLDSGILDPQSISVIAAAGNALVTAKKAPEKRLGLFGMLRAMRDPEMKRTLGFLSEFGSAFGKNLSRTKNPD
jgi:uncharacterized protein YjgD (DUF1641 family)/post-segregation antitoxin (ccd killing protein)